MRANVVGKGCSEVERAYLAGFMDADGAIMACIEKHPQKRYGFRVRVVVKMTQHERKILDWAQRTLSCGAVRANRAGATAQTFDLLIRDQQDAGAVLELLAPWLRVKRRQATIALKILAATIRSKNDLMRVARFADALSRFNVRSKKRRKNYATEVKEHVSRND